MKSKLNIKSILIMALIGILSLVFLGKSFAAVTGKVIVDNANVRETTDTNSKIIEQASKGESVEVIEKEGNWYKVKYNGLQGYIREDLLTVNGEVTEVGNNTVSTKEENVVNNNTVTDSNTVVEQNTVTTNAVTTVNTETTKTGNVLEGMYSVNSDTKLKIVPLVNGINIKEVKKDVTVSVLEVYNNWALVESGNDRGWILFNKLVKVTEPVANTTTEGNQEEQNENTESSVQEKTMYIDGEVVNLREAPSKESDSISTLERATEVTVFGEDGEWSKVRVDGKEGYIKTSLLTDTKPETTTSRSLEQERQPIEEEQEEENYEEENYEEENYEEESYEEESYEEESYEEPSYSGGSELGYEICEFAKQFLGCDYVYGGTSPSGFDCSGFTQYVFANFGIYINRTASAQASNGYYVPKSELQPGDLLIFSGHAGLYIGDGEFIHAANSRSGVIISSIYESYYTRNYVTARRLI